MNIIGKIEQLREERNWTKYKLAEEALLSYSTLASMYARETPPKIDLLEMICNAFGITLAQFFSDENETEIINESERKLLISYRRLPAEKKNALLELLE